MDPVTERVTMLQTGEGFNTTIYIWAIVYTVPIGVWLFHCAGNEFMGYFGCIRFSVVLSWCVTALAIVTVIRNV